MPVTSCVDEINVRMDFLFVSFMDISTDGSMDFTQEITWRYTQIHGYLFTGKEIMQVYGSMDYNTHWISMDLPYKCQNMDKISPE